MAAVHRATASSPDVTREHTLLNRFSPVDRLISIIDTGKEQERKLLLFLVCERKTSIAGKRTGQTGPFLVSFQSLFRYTKQLVLNIDILGIPSSLCDTSVMFRVL